MNPNLQIKNRLSTSRLNLSLLALEDCDFMFSIVNSKGWVEYIGDRNVHSKKDAVEFINKLLNTENLFYWVVRIRDTNTSIGIVSFIKRNYLENFDIGFAFLPEFSGKGYAFEASKEILSLVSKEPSFSPVLATTLPSNKHSIRLLTKLGFSFEKEQECENERLYVYTYAIFPLKS